MSPKSFGALPAAAGPRVARDFTQAPCTKLSATLSRSEASETPSGTNRDCIHQGFQPHRRNLGNKIQIDVDVALRLGYRDLSNIEIRFGAVAGSHYCSTTAGRRGHTIHV